MEWSMTLQSVFDLQRRSRWVLGFIVLSVLLCTGRPAIAHRVMIFAWEEGGIIHTKSKFSGGKTVKEGKIIVSDLFGNQVLEGKTDNKGEFFFKAPENTGLKIVLQAGMGHRAEWTMSGEEARESISKRESQPVSGAGLSTDEIESAIERAIDKKLKPVIRILVEERESSPSVRDILGGIGYILGLVGIGSYFHYRRKMKDMA